MRFSAQKSKGRAKEYKRILEKIKGEKEELLADDIESINPSFEVDADTGYSHSSKSEDRAKDDHAREDEKTPEKGKQAEAKERDAKAGKSKEKIMKTYKLTCL